MKRPRLASVMLLTLTVLFGMVSCTSRGVVEPGVTSDVAGSTLKNPPPQTVTVVENAEGNLSWNTTSGGPVKASRVNADGVTHIGNGVTRQMYFSTGATTFSLGSETDIFAEGLKVTDPTGEVVLIQAEKFGTQTSEPMRAFAEVLDSVKPIVEAVVNGQKDVALKELETQGAAIQAVSPDLFAWLTKLVAGL